MICAWIETSSAETASSQTMNDGFTASARAIPMRCLCPPENSCGYRFVKFGFKPTSRNSSCTRRRRSRIDPIAKLSSGSCRMSPTVIRGSKEANGSWKIICILRRTRRRRQPRRRVMSVPSKTTLPAVTGSKAVIRRARVDFPQPDSPTRPTVSPRRISRSTPSTARTAAPPRPLSGKCLNAPDTRSTTGSGVAEEAGSAACNVADLRGGRLSLELLRRLDRQRGSFGCRDVLVLHVAHQHPAARDLIDGYLAERRFLDTTAVDHERAAWVELAARRRIHKVWREATNRNQA